MTVFFFLVCPAFTSAISNLSTTASMS